MSLSSIPTPVMIAGVAIGLAIVAALGLRAALMLQELFQRLGRLEKAADRAAHTDSDEEQRDQNEGEDQNVDRQLVNDIRESVERNVRLNTRFWGLVRLWSFLVPAKVPRFAPRDISAIDILRCAQKMIANPYRWCGYADAVDRWGRGVDWRFGGHAFSRTGAFWRVVNDLEQQGYKFDNAFLDAVEELLALGKSYLKRHHGWYDGGYLGHLAVLAQYELAIRACHTDEQAVLGAIANALSKDDDPAGTALRKLKHAIFHVP